MKDMELKLFILQGLPGAGKSTLAKELAGSNGEIFSADDFFIDEKGNYNYKEDSIFLAHFWNNQRIRYAIHRKTPIIVIDNTSVSFEDLQRLKPVMLEAKDAGYNIEIKRPTTPWAYNVDELAKKNTHNVPKERIQERLDNFAFDVTVDDILKSPMT